MIMRGHDLDEHRYVEACVMFSAHKTQFTVQLLIFRLLQNTDSKWNSVTLFWSANCPPFCFNGEYLTLFDMRVQDQKCNGWLKAIFVFTFNSVVRQGQVPPNPKFRSSFHESRQPSMSLITPWKNCWQVLPPPRHPLRSRRVHSKVQRTLCITWKARRIFFVR